MRQSLTAPVTSSRTRVVSVAAAASPPQPSPSPPTTSKTPKINIIPNNGRDAGRALSGIPPVMGAHLMASGAVAPMSVSKGPGLDQVPHQFQYLTTEGNASLVLYFSSAGVAQGVVKAVEQAAEAAIKAKGSFTLVLSGGSLPSLLSGLVAKKDAAWDKWHIFYADERNVPYSSPDSNHKAVLDAFLSEVPIPASNIHAILENVPVEQAAINYEGRLIGLPASILPRRENGFPAFDLVLLGLGPDGHICSLFPNRSQTAATHGWVLPVTDSPKPPPERITLTMPVLNAAKEVIFVAAGEPKAEIVQRVLEVQALPGALPAQMVRPVEGTLRWFLDISSAQHLRIDEWDSKKVWPRSVI